MFCSSSEKMAVRFTLISNVLVNRKDYISKIKLISANTSKFKKIQIDDSKVLNHLIHMENKILQFLKGLKEKQEISDKVYN